MAATANHPTGSGVGEPRVMTMFGEGTRRRLGLAFLVSSALSLATSACNRPYRIGEHVWVEWDGRRYRAFIVERQGVARWRVQFEGCDSHWQRDVALDKIHSRLDEAEEGRAPARVACSPVEAAVKGGPPGVATTYKAGDRIRVRWRNSVYTASVVSVAGPDKFLVHYEGHEAAWDEVVSLERVEGSR